MWAELATVEYNIHTYTYADPVRLGYRYYEHLLVDTKLHEHANVNFFGVQRAPGASPQEKVNILTTKKAWGLQAARRFVYGVPRALRC